MEIVQQEGEKEGQLDGQIFLFFFPTLGKSLYPSEGIFND